jgi:hypothetical protein
MTVINEVCDIGQDGFRISGIVDICKIILFECIGLSASEKHDYYKPHLQKKKQMPRISKAFIPTKTIQGK